MRALSLAGVLLALQAGAAPRVSLLKFMGPRGPPARTALEAVLCKRVECIDSEQVSTRFAADWKKGSALGVTFMIEGTAVRAAGAIELTVQLLKPDGSASTQRVALPLTETSANKLASDLMTLMDPAPAPPRVVVAPVKPAEPEPIAAVAAPEVVAAPAPTRAAARQYSFSGELGVNAYNRSFDYLGARVPELRRYSLPLVALINARLEWFPFAGREGLLGGVGAEVGGSLAPWIRSAPPWSSNSLPTFTSRTDLAVLLRVPRGQLVIVPVLGVRLHTFTILGATEDGATIDGMPNLTYVALRAGVGAEVALTARFMVFARVAALPLLSAAQLISASYFPTGGAIGIEATGGAGVKLFPGVEARLSFDWTRYMFWFHTNIATSRFYARGAFDQYLGVTALVRFEL